MKDVDGIGMLSRVFCAALPWSVAPWLEDGMDFLVREQPSENGEVEKAILSSEDQVGRAVRVQH